MPLLLVEAVRDLAAGRTSAASSMTTLIAERFERLSSSAETALIFGAVLGVRFDLGTLAAATAWRDDQILDAIGEWIECGFVRAAARSPDLAFEFTHDLVRVAAIERISGSDLTRAHGLIARALLAQAPESGSRARQIAGHFAAAGEPLRAADNFRSAARYALGVFANEEARESVNAALDLCDENDPSQRALRYELVDLREQSLARIGATEQRRSDARLLVSLADGEGPTAVALGRLFEAYATDAVGRKEALDRLAEFAGTSELAARTHVNATARHAYLEGEYAYAREATLRAATAAERAGDSVAALKARFIGITCLTRLGLYAQGEAEINELRPIVDASDDDVLRSEFHLVASAGQGETHREEALADARRSLALALRIGDRSGEARARHNVAVIAGKLRMYEEALVEHERALDASRDVGDAPGVRDALLNIVGVRIWCGDYARPQQLLDEVGVEDEATPWLALRCQLIRGALAQRTERTADAERYLLDAHRRAEELGASPYRARSEFELAYLLASHGRPGEAAVYINSALETYATMGQPDIEIEALALGARLLASLGDAPGARERANHAAGRCREKRLQSYSEVAWNLAAAYALIGDQGAAETYARDAAAAAVDDAVRMPADLAEAYLQLRWHQETVAYLWGRPVSLRFE